jgi:hypothetical protein
MATLVFTALGTALGGPLGGALGSLVGSQIDRSVLGGGARREGPRLKELAVTASSYGTPLPGTSALCVQRGRSSGRPISRSRARPAAARASRAPRASATPLVRGRARQPADRGLGRIWADGQLLRGAAGDLKTGGALRIHLGHGDQLPDPLIARRKARAAARRFAGSPTACSNRCSWPTSATAFRR